MVAMAVLGEAGDVRLAWSLEVAEGVASGLGAAWVDVTGVAGAASLLSVEVSSVVMPVVLTPVGLPRALHDPVRSTVL